MADQQHEIRFLANPTQKAFIESRAEADLFDCRKGEGKSAALAWACFFHTRENPGAEWLMIRDTWENCRRTTQREFFHWFPPGVMGEYRAGDKEFIWRAERIGLTGRVTFIGLDAPEDAHKVASMPLGAFGMDEPAPAAGESEGIAEFIFDTAMAQLRQPGMNWYAAKLAQNNPDETHWTYKRFWDPGTELLSNTRAPRQLPGFQGWQPPTPENNQNLPAGYYERLGTLWRNRPDLVRRFVEGRHGFQQIGKAVTPEWSNELHLAQGLKPFKGVSLHLLWDFGLNPTCLITQVTPLGTWNILEAYVGDDIGAFELIDEVVRPRLAADYKGFVLQHIGDPAGDIREQSSSKNSAVGVIRKSLGGTWRPGPRGIDDRVNPLRAVLRRNSGGSPPAGVMQVDREGAKEVWHALRGGWHRQVHRTGVIGDIVKDMHSHPGDAIGYGAAVLFPTGTLARHRRRSGSIPHATYGFNDGSGQRPNDGGSIGFEQPGRRIPREARRIG